MDFTFILPLHEGPDPPAMAASAGEIIRTANRNDAAVVAHGTWLVPLRPGDELSSDWPARCRAAASDDPAAAILYGEVLFVGLDCQAARPQPEWSLADLLALRLRPDIYAVRRTAWQAVGGWHDYGSYSDWELWLRLAAAGQHGRRVPGLAGRCTCAPLADPEAEALAYTRAREAQRALWRDR